MKPACSNLHTTNQLELRAEQAREKLLSCTLCPRQCHINRMRNERGFCETGRYARVASYGPHFGEEQPLTGRNGSGTIFFSSCNLRCCFCQNYELSQQLAPAEEVDRFGLAAIMINLQDRGCHNINVVTPSHVLPQLIEALPPALEQGLSIPLVYNCSGYESLESLALLAGIVDIYLVDFKLWQPHRATAYLGTADYPEVARTALKAMHRQVGNLVLDAQGIAVRGLMVRHLLMPGALEDTEAIITFLATEIATETYVNIMDQYRPCGAWQHHPELGFQITEQQYREALAIAEAAGLHQLDRRDIGTLLRRLGII